MASEEERRARLRSLYDLVRQSEELAGGVTLEEEVGAVIVGGWALLAFDEQDRLAASFHLDSHPNAVSHLTRHLVEHGVTFALNEAFVVDDEDRIVFESDAEPPDGESGLVRPGSDGPIILPG
jgi:hypothetical protein